jgi:sporulation protein YlmC with PRC-barrel domain
MRARTLIFAPAVLLLAAFPALAAPCKLGDLPQMLAALPDFIVMKKGEKSRDALTRVLGCELPRPAYPSFAGGQKIEPVVMVGKNVFSAKGDSIGVIKDVVVNRNNFKVNSVIKLKPELGASYVAIPVSAMENTKGTLSLPGDDSTLTTTATPFHLDNNFVSLSTTSWFDIFRPPMGQIRLRVESEPSGATFFAHDQAYGSTEIEGLLNPAYKDSIRLEKQGYKPCQFSDGTYTDPTGAVDYATFQCKLKTP